MVWYLKGTIEYSIIYARDNRIFLQIYDDFDWDKSATNRKITPTCCRKWINVYLSATKDEYIATVKKETEYSSSDEEY